LTGGIVPEFSFIIVCLNNRELLGPCIDSIYGTLDIRRLEIIVSDNGSTDGSREVIRRRYPGVVLIENGKNLGFAKAVNRGIERAGGKYVVVMNSDARLGPNAVDRIGRFMDGHPEVAIAGGRLVDPDGTPQNSAAAFPGMMTELGGKSIAKLLFPGRFPGRVRKGAHAPFDVDSIVGALMVVRADAIERVGRLDEDYFFFLEETDWCLRMRRAGMRVVVVPDAEIVHGQGMTAKRYPIRAKIEYYRSLLTFMRKNRPPAYRALFSSGLLLKFVVNLVVQFLFCSVTLFFSHGPRERCARYLRLIIWFVSGRPASWGLAGAAR
jgi:GT2 family glycosyltransferase